MAGSFLDLTGLTHFKDKLMELVASELSAYVKKADLSDGPTMQTCSEMRDRDSSKPTYGLEGS